MGLSDLGFGCSGGHITAGELERDLHFGKLTHEPYISPTEPLWSSSTALATSTLLGSSFSLLHATAAGS